MSAPYWHYMKASSALSETLVNEYNQKVNDDKEELDQLIMDNYRDLSERRRQVLQATSSQEDIGQCCAIRKSNPIKDIKMIRKKSIERKLSISKLDNNDDSRNFSSAMYKMSSLQLKTRRYTNAHNSNFISKTPLKPYIAATKNLHRNNSKLTASLLTIAAVTLITLSSCLALTNENGSSSSSSSSTTPSISASILSAITNGAGSSQTASDAKHSMSDRVDSPATGSESKSSHQQTSVVASLSSAVASAAAAAAVAAAQNSLSGGDGRSLLSASTNAARQHQQHQARSPGLNLALKIADSIPEVPYNILHNMKKIDHAAPFYNVAMNNKMSAIGAKESGHNLLANALSSATSSGFGSEQLSSLFKSPLWKRIADGYGEFTSEFRTLFRAPTPMKGPISPTSKLIRDISVPALLMLVASAIPSDWSPIKMRRKSLFPSVTTPASNILSSPVDPMNAAASIIDMPNFSFPPPQMLKQAQPNNLLQNFMASPQARSMGQSYDQMLIESPSPKLRSQARAPSSLASQSFSSSAENNLQLLPTASEDSASWLQSQLLSGQSQASSTAAAASPSSSVTYNAQQPQTQSVQQATRRLGEFINGAERQNSVKHYHQEESTKPVQQSSQTGGDSESYGSLTSNWLSGQNKLMNKITNANSGNLLPATPSNPNRMINLINGLIQPMEARQDQLSDKNKYSLIYSENDLEPKIPPASPLTKPFLLSAMSHALTSMFNTPSAASESGSNHNNQVHGLNGDRTINLQREISSSSLSPSRKQPAIATSGQVLSEQRDLSQFLPQSWKEIAKRTIGNVQQQATTQWKSIEGQLTNWVQDKLKTLPMAASQTSPVSPTSGGQGAKPSLPNIIASVGSTAMNILGLGNKSSHSTPSVAAPSSAPSAGSESSVTNASANTDDSQKSKSDLTGNKSTASNGTSAKSALAGVANMIVNTFTNRQNPSTTQPKSSSPSEPIVASQYPTLTGAQSSSQMASGTASTVAGISTQMV